LNSKRPTLFMNRSDCPLSIYQFDPSNKQFAAFRERGQRVLILKDQPTFKPFK
jgi:hypothetical protein